MKVVYGSTTLCDGVDYDGTVGKFIGPLGTNTFRMVWDQAPRKYIGAANATPSSLGNALGEFNLRVGVEFATVAAAQYFCYTHAQGLDQTADITITGDDGDTETFALASITECSIEQTGCGVLIDYKFQTGVLDEEEA